MVRLHDSRSSGTPFVAALAALVASCASLPPEPRTIDFAGSAGAERRRPGGITSYQKAVDSVLWVMEDRLGFPPFEGTLELYPDRAGMVVALEREGLRPSSAQQIADHLDGIALPGRILANDSVLRWQHWPVRIVFLAHELTHVAEFALAGGRRGSADQWLREGFAEWVSWRVVDDLGLASYGARRRVALSHMREVCGQRELPSFSELIIPSAWLPGTRPSTADPKYDQAFLAAELLVSLHGLPTTLAYFRLYARSEDSPANFRTAFGEEPDHFEATFQAHLNRALQ